MIRDDGDGRLFDAPAVEAEPAVKARVDKTFRAYDPHQILLLPPSIYDWSPEEHLARFVSELVGPRLLRGVTDRSARPMNGDQSLLRCGAHAFVVAHAGFDHSQGERFW